MLESLLGQSLVVGTWVCLAAIEGRVSLTACLRSLNQKTDLDILHGADTFTSQTDFMVSSEDRRPLASLSSSTTLDFLDMRLDICATFGSVATACDAMTYHDTHVQ
ncbi:hypothetical protein NW759_002231 [Fusarium solani]|nr:hypothetical protein NW759_002231 [Fusarium solani]